MRLLRPAVFAALVLATVGAFFVTQHLKVTTPLINGDPKPAPSAFNPIDGRICRGAPPHHKLIDYRRVRISFYLQHRADNVAVYVVNDSGQIVATVASDRYMAVDNRNPDGDFSWNGREGNQNGPYAPPGTYYFRVALLHEGRTFTLTKPFQIITSPPHPVVTSVVASGSGMLTTGAAVLTPPQNSVTIHFKPGDYRTTRIQLYRTDLPGRPVMVKSFGVAGRRGVAVWNGLIAGQPAPAGTYLVGISVTDQACNLGQFPIVMPPPPGTTPHTGVTVRYLAAAPPLTPTGAGSVTTVPVYSSGVPYVWSLRRVGTQLTRTASRHHRGRRRKPQPTSRLRGRVARARATLPLRFVMPADGAGLYELALRSGVNRTIVPVIASSEGRRAAAHVLVVLPSLTWQGENPVDDDGDGLPDTLAGGESIALDRPFADGLPAGFGEEAALLVYLDSHHINYQLTSDLALAQGVGPQLHGHTGVILDGSITWAPSVLGQDLLAYVGNGGRLVSIGQSSMLRTVPITKGSAGPSAGPSSAAAAHDPFGARPGGVVATHGELITVISDPLDIFSTTSGAFSGFDEYQVIAPPDAAGASLAGIARPQFGVSGFRIGRGIVVEIGLDGFSSSLAHNTDSQELLARLWQLLSG